MPPELLELSLNEVEQLAQKAARGAGLPWGVAEDTGRAAAWIASRAGPWAASLLALLETPPPAEQSPLLLAGTLADAFVPRRIPRVAAPLWALPGLLATTRHTVTVRLDTAVIGCGPRQDATASVCATSLAAIPESWLDLKFADAGSLPHRLARRFRRSLVSETEWQRLTALAFRTYVPASDRSRLTGAGAGLLDDE